MRSIDRLASGSVICGGVALSLFCLVYILNILAPPPAEGILGAVIAVASVTWVGTTLCAVTLGLGSLSRRGVRSGAVHGRTQARIGIGLGLMQVLLYCLTAAYALFFLVGH
jgi:hypothetical protein